MRQRAVQQFVETLVRHFLDLRNSFAFGQDAQCGMRLNSFTGEKKLSVSFAATTSIGIFAPVLVIQNSIGAPQARQCVSKSNKYPAASRSFFEVGNPPITSLFSFACVPQTRVERNGEPFADKRGLFWPCLESSLLVCLSKDAQVSRTV